jgi:ribulose 1,5-bisphosphate synthetase/thiazole synthase
MKYDIIIAGGGTAGCACAYTSSKLGLKILLIEKNSFLGGTMTSALVTPAMKTSDNNINNDFYNTLMNRLHDIGGQITYPDGNIGWFNPELMKIVLDDMMDSANVDVLFNTEITHIKHNNSHITSISIQENNKYTDSIYTDNISDKEEMLSEYIETKYLVDGTGDGKIFEKLNLKFLENKNKFQPNNLRFMMSGIDIKRFSDWILEFDKDRNVTTSYEIDGQIHLSTAYTWDKDKNWALAPIFKQGIEQGYIKEEDSNYFQLFTVAGMPTTIAFNCPRIMSNDDINGDKSKLSKALKEGRQSILRLSVFMQKYFVGFENSYISNIANSLGVRVSNRIRGKYVYTIDDLKSGKNFENPCLVSNYPIDVHSTKQGKSILEHQLVEYSLPIESLISCDFDNLFGIGRCLSADFEAQSALRIIPSCFSMGEGLAKYLANELK